MTDDRSGSDNKSLESGWPIGLAFEVLLRSSDPESSQHAASSKHEPSKKEPVDSRAGLPSPEPSSCDEAATSDPGNECSEAKEEPPLHGEGEVRVMQEDVSRRAAPSTSTSGHVRHTYLNDEQIFASFDSKRRYEREWRKKEKKKGGKKHRKTRN